MDSMSGIATATNEGAEGTTNIAQRASDMKQYAEMVTQETDRCNEAAARLKKEIGAFIIE